MMRSSVEAKLYSCKARRKALSNDSNSSLLFVMIVMISEMSYSKRGSLVFKLSPSIMLHTRASANHSV